LIGLSSFDGIPVSLESATSGNEFTNSLEDRNMLVRAGFTTVALLACVSACLAADAPKPKPIKAMIVTGGCCHDYAKQKEVLKVGLQQRVNVEVTLVHTGDTSTKARFDMYEKPDWAKGFDVIIHDECSSDVKEIPYVENILNAHKDGVAAVNLHCAMHSYRFGRDDWFQFVGIQSSGHGPQKPIDVTFLDKSHPVTKGLENWTTINEELYNNVKPVEGALPLARGRQDTGNKVDDYVVAWANQFGKGRVFSTTLGHNTATVADPHYLDLVSRGLLWSVGKLTDDGKPMPGYEGTGVQPIDVNTLKPVPDPK
jgi:type 1 glutamine amidotransferase